MPLPEQNRPPPNIIHALDQMGAGLRDLSPLLYGFHVDLMDAGFTEDQALELTGAVVRVLLSGDRE